MKANLLYQFTIDLNRYGVHVDSVSYNENAKDDISKHKKRNLVSSKDKKITELIKYLTSTYENKFHFSISEIAYDKKSKLYFSELKVNLL